MTEAIIPFYLDWKFWSFVTAAIAVILSQIPPIHVLLKKAKIDFELYSKIGLSQKVGNPNLQIHLFITNVGGRRIRIKKITASVQRNRQLLVTLPAQNYLQQSGDKNTLLFTSFYLKPEEDWSHIVNLLNFFNRDDERAYREIESSMKADISAQIAEAKARGEESSELFETQDAALTDRAINFFDRHFVWLPGEYRITVGIETDRSEANTSKTFSFTLFESQSEDLRKIREFLKHGGGFWWHPSQVLPEIILDISEST